MLTYSIADTIERFSDEWENLVLDSITATPFQTYEWVSTWFSYFGKSRKAHLFVAREGNDLIGIMPLFESKYFSKTLKPMGKGNADYLHPLIRTGYEQAFSEQFADYVSQLKGFDMIDLEQLRENHTLCAHLTHLDAYHQDSCYLLALPQSYEEYLKTLSKSMRYEARRVFRTPFTTGGASVKLVKNQEELSDALNVFFDLHTKRWRTRALPGSFARPSVRMFHQDFAQKALAKGRLKFLVLEYEKKPIGALYCMKTANRYFFYQSGFDPEFKVVSPGNVLVSYAIQLAINEGATHFDFMRGVEPYKARWKPQSMMKNVRVIKPSSGLKGKVGMLLKTSATSVKLKWTQKSVK